MLDHADRGRLMRIHGARVLLPERGFELTEVLIQDGRILAIGDESLRPEIDFDARGLQLLPGMIDLHGDAFERHITPRAGVQFPFDLAIEANDISLIGNGITTFYYSITDGFEPGLRSRAAVRELLASIAKLQPRLCADSRIHLRHECVNTEAHEELLSWLEAGEIHLLSLNDHLPQPTQDSTRYAASLARRVSMSEQQALALLDSLQTQRDLGCRQQRELAATAKRCGILLASHDVDDTEALDISLELGCRLAEFPATAELASGLRAAGNFILMGAPNLVRGGSHVGALAVREAVEKSLVDILCSDYHYPSLFRAPFLLAEMGLLSFPQAWKLVSENPAHAVGMSAHKGVIQIGASADLLLVVAGHGMPRDIQAVLVAGKQV